MKTNEVVNHINLPGVNGKEIRDYARKFFIKQDGGWDFNEAQVKELDVHFHQKWTFKKTKTDEVVAEVKAGLTTNEMEVMNYLISEGWYAEEGFSSVDPSEVATAINKSMKSVKGYLGSLVKKEYIYIDDDNEDFNIIYAGSKCTYNNETNKYEF